ncbi:MAG: LPXTG cell wall anchor domain-containing protein, partial [Lachnospiraceae bacterium]|nr:LPXTG cell wall anchor domain-containing protein [Lachnospiraceae bacterium]
EELKAAQIPEYIYIDGNSYRVEGLDRLAKYADPSRKDTDTYGETAGRVAVANYSKVFQPGSRIHASLDGSAGDFLLKVEDKDLVRQTLDQAYEAVYGQDLPEDAACFSLELTDIESGVSITRLGNNLLTVTLPLPVNGEEDGIRVVTVDHNGQLENVRYTLGQDGILTFRVSHLSPFAIYSVGAAGGRLDISPDTGEAIHPKWFFAAGIFSLALAILFYRPRRKKITF